MKKFAVIVGGGKGIRLGSEIPKQFLLLKGLPVLIHTIEKFHGIADEIVLVLPESHFEYWNQLCESLGLQVHVKLVAGGATRAQSVMNGLAVLSGQGIVAVHDAVRPLVTKKLINSLYETAQMKGNAVPCVPVKESIRKKNGNTSMAVKREDYLVVQTPQCFDLQELIAAYQKSGELDFTDDAGMMEHFGALIHHIEGEVSNIKITFREDVLLSEALLDAMNL